MLRVFQEGKWTCPEYIDVKSLEAGKRLAKKLMRENENVSDAGVIDENNNIVLRVERIYVNNKIKIIDWEVHPI